MTEPTPLPNELPAWERGLREVLEADEMDTNRFTGSTWIRLIGDGFTTVDSKAKPWDDPMGTPDNNEFTIYRRAAELLQRPPTGNRAAERDMLGQSVQRMFYVIKGKVTWFEKSGEFSPDDYWHQFNNSSNAAVLQPPFPPPLDPSTFRESADSFDNLALWLEDAARRMTAEIENLGGEESGFRGAAAEGLRESLTNLRDELNLLREDLRNADDWAAMLRRNGDAAETFLREIEKAWRAFNEHGGRDPRTMVVKAMEDIEKSVDGLGRQTDGWNVQALQDNLLLIWDDITEWKIPIDFGNGEKHYDFKNPGTALTQLDADMHGFFAQAAQGLHDTMTTQFRALRDSFETTYGSLVDPRTYTPPPPSSGNSNGNLDLDDLLGKGGTGGGGSDLNSLLGGGDLNSLLGGGGIGGTGLGGGSDLNSLLGGGSDLNSLLDGGTGLDGLLGGGSSGADGLDPGSLGDKGSGLSGLNGLGSGPDAGGVGTGSGLGVGGLPNFLGGLNGRPANDDRPVPSQGGPADGDDFEEVPKPVGGLPDLGSPGAGGSFPGLDGADRPGTGGSLPGLGLGVGSSPGLGGPGAGGSGDDFLSGGLGSYPGLDGIGGAATGSAGAGDALPHRMTIGPLGSAPATTAGGAGLNLVPVAGPDQPGPNGVSGAFGPAGGYPPMMPPMSGMGGGGQQEKERERTTWLAEEEEVWGTDPDVAPGVVGRDEIPEPASDGSRWSPAAPQTPVSPYGPARGGGQQVRRTN